MRLWIVSARFGVGRGFELFRRGWGWCEAVNCVGEVGFVSVRFGLARGWIVGARVGLGARLWFVWARVGLGRGCELLGARLDLARGWIVGAG